MISVAGHGSCGSENAPLNRMERFALRFAELANNDPRGKWLQTRFLRGVSYAVGARRDRAADPDRWPRRGDRAAARDRRHGGLEPSQLLRPVHHDARVLHGPGAVGEAPVLPGPRELLLRQPARRGGQRRDRRWCDVSADLSPGRAPRAQRRRARSHGRDRAARRATWSACTPKARAARAPIRISSCRRSPASASSRSSRKPMVIPAFILGLGNNIAMDIAQNFGKNARRDNAVIIMFGKPVDYSDLAAEKPRPTLYKKCADRFMSAIKVLGEEQKALRARGQRRRDLRRRSAVVEQPADEQDLRARSRRLIPHRRRRRNADIGSAQFSITVKSIVFAARPRESFASTWTVSLRPSHSRGSRAASRA